MAVLCCVVLCGVAWRGVALRGVALRVVCDACGVRSVCVLCVVLVWCGGGGIWSLVVACGRVS